jgi:putative cell wall-binding protein
MFRRSLVALTTAALCAMPAVAHADTTPIAETGKVRLSGADRYATSVAISRKTFTTPQDRVVIVTGEDWPDGLAAGPLAARWKAPVLLVSRTGVPAVVRGELQRLHARELVVVGGPATVPESVVRQAAQWSTTVTRVSGANRYETAEAAARAMPSVDAVYLASGAGFADALSSGAVAAAENGAVLLTSPSTLSPATARALRATTPAKVVVVGGPSVISPAVEAQVRAAVPGATVTRVYGSDRYYTAFLLAMPGWGAREDGSNIFYASGTSFADALSGAPAAYVNDAPILLTRGTCTPGTTEFMDQEVTIKLKVFLGGPTVTYSGSRLCPL